MTARTYLAYPRATGGIIGVGYHYLSVSGSAGHWRAQVAVNHPRKLWGFKSLPAHHSRCVDALSSSLFADQDRSSLDVVDGKAVLLVEQRARAALQVADWTSVLVSGVTRLEGSPDDLLKRQDFEELFLGAGPRSAAPRVEEEDNT